MKKRRRSEPEGKKAEERKRERRARSPSTVVVAVVVVASSSLSLSLNPLFFFFPKKKHDIFQAGVADVVAGALDGYNGTVLAYGQTGSGKTHTMIGTIRVFSFCCLLLIRVCRRFRGLERRNEKKKKKK